MSDGIRHWQRDALQLIRIWKTKNNKIVCLDIEFVEICRRNCQRKYYHLFDAAFVYMTIPSIVSAHERIDTCRLSTDRGESSALAVHIIGNHHKCMNSFHATMNMSPELTIQMHTNTTEQKRKSRVGNCNFHWMVAAAVTTTSTTNRCIFSYIPISWKMTNAIQ